MRGLARRARRGPARRRPTPPGRHRSRHQAALHGHQAEAPRGRNQPIRVTGPVSPGDRRLREPRTCCPGGCCHRSAPPDCPRPERYNSLLLEPASSARASKARTAAISSASLSVTVALKRLRQRRFPCDPDPFSCSASPFRHSAISLRIEPRPGLFCERAVILFRCPRPPHPAPPNRLPPTGPSR